eukprot:1283028-Prymnesium_polylepis.1
MPVALMDSSSTPMMPRSEKSSGATTVEPSQSFQRVFEPSSSRRCLKIWLSSWHSRFDRLTSSREREKAACGKTCSLRYLPIRTSRATSICATTGLKNGDLHSCARKSKLRRRCRIHSAAAQMAHHVVVVVAPDRARWRTCARASPAADFSSLPRGAGRA